MIFQHNPYFQILADIIGFILAIFRPFVVPIGRFMVYWVDFFLTFFPSNSLVLYIVIFVVLVLSGIIINWIWPGDQPLGYKPVVLSRAKRKNAEITKKEAEEKEKQTEEEAKEIID
ncbi:MAG: hypothetical protein ACFFAN_02540 [Promethearchaeota archaeon]